MRGPNVASLGTIICSVTFVLFAFQAPELGANGKRGVDMVNNKIYDRAVPYLEQGLTETPDNPVLYEYLGVAYLGCSSSLDMAECIKKAEENMDKAISLGGRATFIVDRSLEKQAFFLKVPNPLHMKRGYIHVTKSEFVFEPANGPGLITIPAADIKEAGLNTSSGKSTNIFHITSKTQGRFEFRTANFSADEARLLFRLMQKYLGISTK